MIIVMAKAGFVNFYRIMFLVILVFFVLFIINPEGSQLNVFFLKTDDFFADFFNVLRYISEKDPYHNEINGLGEKCYFPLAYILLYPFTYLDNYTSMSLVDCWHSDMSIISCVIFAFLSCLIFVHSLFVLVKDKLGWQIYFILLLSYIFLFSIERGNFIVLTACAINYYLAFYKSKVICLRYWALIALCFAVTLKVYPALLGLLLLKEKRYCDILFCIVVTTGLVFLPFLFFENGFDNIAQLFNNIKLNSSSYSPYRIYPRYSLSSLLYVILALFKVSDTVISPVLLLSRVAIVLLSLVSLYLAFKVKDLWKTLALLTVVLIFLPTNSALYCGLYFFPVIILFFRNEIVVKREMIYILLFCMFLNPIQIMVKGFNVSYILSNLSLLVFWGIIIVTSCVETFKRKEL